MRILHTADWQLGLRAAQAGERAQEVRAERLVALERVVELAHELDVDLVLAAGDLFDRQDVDESVVEKAIESLNLLEPIVAVLLPGNHDPYAVGGVWTRSAWSNLGGHVSIASESAEMEPLSGLALYPSVLTQKRSRQDPTAWIPVRRTGDDRLRVGLAHGSLDSLAVRGSNFPIARDRPELAGLDYLALGDWHGVSIQGRAAYPGTIEQTSHSEKLAGFVLLVELDESRSRMPSIEQHRIGRFVWLELAADINDRTDIERLEEQVRTAARPENLLLRANIRLQKTERAVVDELAKVREELESRLFLLDWRQSDRSTADDLPRGLLGDADETLALVIDGHLDAESMNGVPEALLDADPAVLAEARSVLRRLHADSVAETER